MLRSHSALVNCFFGLDFVRLKAMLINKYLRKKAEANYINKVNARRVNSRSIKGVEKAFRYFGIKSVPLI